MNALGDEEWTYTQEKVFMYSIMANNVLFTIVALCKSLTIINSTIGGFVAGLVTELDKKPISPEKVPSSSFVSYFLFI